MNQQATAQATARSDVYEFLALGFAAPVEGRLQRLKAQLPALEAGLARLGHSDGATRTRRVGDLLAASDATALERSYARCFGHAVSKECPPYEAEYGQAHIFQKAHALADVAGFYRAFGLELAADFNDRPDHVSAELEFMHFLCLKEAYALVHVHSPERLTMCRQAQGKFLDEHLGRWTPAFSRRLSERAPDGVHAVLGELLAVFVAADMEALRVEPAGALDAPGPGPAAEPAACERCAIAGSGLDGGGLP